MKNIIERLRWAAVHGEQMDAIDAMEAAADEIERLLAALKECALEIAQIRDRRLTTGEQDALDAARFAIARAEARSCPA